MFVPLRLHSVYSRGKGSVTLEEAAGWAAAKRLPAAALADTGNIYGWGKWKRVAPAGGFKPLFGCELEVGGRRFVFLVRTREGYPSLMEIFNRREIRDTAGLVVIYVPDGGEAGAKAKDGDTKGDTYPGSVSPSGSPAGSGAAGRASEAAMLGELRGKVAPGDLYIGADFGNFGRILGTCTPGTCPQESISAKLEHVPDSPFAGLPVVWANPVKYLTSPERLVLVHAIERKIPYPPERDRLLAKIGIFGPDQ